jgi:hypothetical protein
LLVASVLTACGESTSPMTGSEGNVILRDENNYTSTSTLTIPSVQTVSGADIQICWDGLAKDILCHDMNPAMEIGNVTLLRVLSNFTKSQIEAEMAVGALGVEDLRSNFTFLTRGTSTCAMLTQFGFQTTLAMPAQDYVEGADKYMLLFATGTTPGSGARTMLFLEPMAASTNTTATAPDGCNILDFQADVASRQRLTIPTAGPWVLDWSQLTKDGIGGKVQFDYIDSVLLGFYEGMTVADLETRFVDLDRIATSIYRMAVPRNKRSVNLAEAKDDSGQMFPGFTRTTSGVWAVAVLCSKCQIPAPVALAILQPG